MNDEMPEFDFYDLNPTDLEDASYEDNETITITPDSFTMVEFSPEGSQVFVDVVLSIICTHNETGHQKSYKLVKRLGFDKFKIAHEAKQNPVCVVEHFDSVFSSKELKKQYDAEKSIVEAKRLAKMPIDAGKQIFEVSFIESTGAKNSFMISARNEGHALIKMADDVIPNQYPGSLILKISKF
jgi:hypothetical protein